MVTEAGNIQPIRIEDEMRTSYLGYAMSVIVSRALPDVRDGLKPVQRRILYAMHELGLRPGTQYKKSARIVGEVLGKYHPHGDAPVYDALVRMAQEFSLRYPLVDGQGNFGSIDNDPPAAMRYTEARLASITEEMLADIDLNTVDFNENFDATLKEPVVLPALLPSMLLNGASGIAVGMATNIPPHNLTEICDAVTFLIDHPDATVDDLIKRIPGPDFPTGAIIQGRAGIIDAYTTGHGRAVMQARTEIEELRGGREQIVVTEVPFQVNKASLVEKIAHLVRDRRVEGISDIRDESDRQGIRMVVELKRDAQAEIVLNNLYKHTSLRSSFNIIMLALVDGQPQVMGLKRALQLYIDHRKQVITRRSEHLLTAARERAHIVEGLRLAIERLDEVIEIIRGSADAATARANLVATLDLTEVQASAILDMQLRRLAALERERLEGEYKDLLKRIAELEALLADPGKVLSLVRQDAERLKKRFGDPRRTEIREGEVTAFSMEEYVLHQDVLITLTRRGYIKRIALDTYKAQHRGGKGVRGMTTRDDDPAQDVVVADTHETLLFFTNRGRVFHLRSFGISADTSRTSRGTPLVNLIKVVEGERVNAMVAVPDLGSDNALVMATRKGEVKRIRLKDLGNIRSPGLRAMDLEPGDELVSARLANEEDDVMIVTRRGQGVRFSITDVRQRSRAAGGVRGVRLSDGDIVVSMEVVRPDDALLVVTSRGFGKLVHMNRFRRQGRGVQGPRAFKTTGKSGMVAGARVVKLGRNDEVMLVTAKGKVVRTPMDEIRFRGRTAGGVIVVEPAPDDEVVSIHVQGIGRNDGTNGTNGTAKPEQGNGRNESPASVDDTDN